VIQKYVVKFVTIAASIQPDSLKCSITNNDERCEIPVYLAADLRLSSVAR
jgi:hypothetical protein